MTVKRNRSGQEICELFIQALEEADRDAFCVHQKDIHCYLFDTGWIDEDELYRKVEEKFNKE